MNNNRLMDEIARVLANTNDDGRNGKAFEGLVKQAIIGYVRGDRLVTSNKKNYDFTMNGVKYEVKSGCGELDTLLQHYEKEHNVVVVYSPTANIEDMYMLSVRNFIEGLNAIGLIRTKKSSKGKEVHAIQSFKNSQRKTKQLYEMLNEYNIL